jgi:hypothetical protein
MLQRHASGPVSQVSGYVDASFALDRDAIAEEYHNTIRSAPTRTSSYIVDHDISGRSVRSNRREELLAHRIYEAGATLSFPGWPLIDVVDFQTPLNARRGDGLGKVDLLGISDGLCVIELKALNKSGSADTPLNALLEAVGYCAVITANASTIEKELRHAGRTVTANELSALVLAPNDYWERWDRTRRPAPWRSALAYAAAVVFEATTLRAEFGSFAVNDVGSLIPVADALH